MNLRDFKQLTAGAVSMLILLLASVSAALASDADELPVAVQVQAAHPIGRLPPIWRFFGVIEID